MGSRPNDVKNRLTTELGGPGLKLLYANPFLDGLSSQACRESEGIAGVGVAAAPASEPSLGTRAS